MISYANSIKNKPILADRSINDGNGNEIARTYATKAEVPTVDQTYDSTSTNAQSGVAVAQAIAAIPQTGGSDEWWGGDPGAIDLPKQTLRLRFKDLTYDPRNETDTTFTDHFQSITKVSDGVYDFYFANDLGGDPMFSGSFRTKYVTDNEFIVVAFNFGTYNNDKSKGMSSMFENCTGLRAVYNVQDTTDNQRRDGSFSNMFSFCTNLVYFSVKEKTVGSNDFRISTVSDFTRMFAICTSLVDCNLVISRVSGSSSADCTQMFRNCTSLVTGPSVDNGVSNATNMFLGCSSLRGFHVNHILGTYDIPADTSCNCSSMFENCESLKSADIPFFLYHTVSNAHNMFSGCKMMTTPPRHIKVTSGVSSTYMFNNCWALESLPKMDYGSISAIDYMFQNCVMLSDISTLENLTWNASLTSVAKMFNQCWSIEKGLKAVYDDMADTPTITSHIDTFKGCGTAFSNPQLAHIPASWGGTGS